MTSFSWLVLLALCAPISHPSYRPEWQVWRDRQSEGGTARMVKDVSPEIVEPADLIIWCEHSSCYTRIDYPQASFWLPLLHLPIPKELQ